MARTLSLDVSPDPFSADGPSTKPRGQGADALVEVANDTSSGTEACSLEELVYERLRLYAESLQGHYPEDMYRLIMPQLERPLIQIAMELSRGEKKSAAKMLGIHRNTLRARLRDLGMESAPRPRKSR
ncbi:MAG: helix-turn-helix domain-containing protein [Myxococcota bacterium]